MDHAGYHRHFRDLSGYSPYEYQVQVAELLFSGRNVLLRAPTGAGKTWSVLAPFFYSDWPTPPSRLIYALPLRTLAQSVYREAREAAGSLGHPIDGITRDSREIVSPFVTLQTGEQPDDPFFDRGRIIVTTYDQLLSGILCGPYSLSGRLHNVNAAAIAGALVVFDEFHLMSPDKAFLTAAAALRAFRDLCQSVWMTATATSPLEQILCKALDTACVPKTAEETEHMMASLPSVNSVTRTLAWEAKALGDDPVHSHHRQRAIVLANTVGRAQDLFEQLRARLANQPDVNLVLLHSRFFKSDRQNKEHKLRGLFGRSAQGSSILVATQVIEAGVDISCDQMHTELCPMNALVQRAGRCARFPGERGHVHVYELPKSFGWLPYGTLQKPDSSIDATRELLRTSGHTALDPILVAEWVEKVHRDEDELAVKPGIQSRIGSLLDAIHRNAIQRDTAGIAHLIRGDDSESIRVIVSEAPQLPNSPGRVETISMSRWSLAPHLSPPSPIGWYWDGDETRPWKELIYRDHLASTYAVALPPAIASYDDCMGLRLGRSGTSVSPPRVEPPRPGYAPLREESWVNHANMVGAASGARLQRDGFPAGMIGRGFEKLYGLTAQHMQIAARACGHLHDLGKLQARWQQWAQAWRLSKNSSSEPGPPLAHTDFDPDSNQDRERQRSLGRRPPHAAASAYYGCSLLSAALEGIPDELLAHVASACAAAIIAHHGGFIPRSPDSSLGVLELSAGWEQVVFQCMGRTPDPKIAAYLSSERDKRGYLNDFLEMTTSRDSLTKWWPLVSYLTRTLRLSDRRATSEWACSE